MLAAGCETRTGAAAIVGGEKVTNDRLDSLVNESLNAPGVRAALPNTESKGDLAEYRRGVLFLEVNRLLAAAAVGKLNISVASTDIDDRYSYYESNFGGAADFPAQLAAKTGYSPSLFRQTEVPTEVMLAEIGYQQGKVARPSEAELRAKYPAYAAQATRASLVVIQVPDGATAQRIVNQAKADPTSLQAAAQQYANGAPNAGQPQDFEMSQLPGPVAAWVPTAKAGDFFVYAPEGANGAFVVRFGALSKPSYAASRAQLLSDSFEKAYQSGQAYIKTLAKQVGVEINPRYGSWDADKMTITDFNNPVIKTSPSPSATPGQNGGATGGTPANPANPGG
jgi:hypothetical protein